MKKILLATSLLFLLAACGGKDDSASNGAIGTDDSPQVVVPAGASLEEYTCEEVSDFVENGNDGTEKISYAGKTREWKEGEFTLIFDEDADGSFKSLTKYRRETVSVLQYRTLSNVTSWFLKQSSWSKRAYSTEKLYSRDSETAGYQMISYKRDGVEMSFDWTYESADESEQGYTMIGHHKNPGSRNRDDRIYKKIEETCVIKKR